jgi:uncharacterized membrane protein
MTEPSVPAKMPASPSLSVRFGQGFRRYFVAGLATLLPVLVTVFLIVKIFEFADGLLGDRLGLKIPGLGLVLTVLVIMAVGAFSVHVFGRAVVRTLETAFLRLPFVRKIYPAVKQLAQFLFSGEKGQGAFRRVVLVEFPRPGSYAIAFVTNEGSSSVTGSQTNLLTLLVPSPPSPFSGPIIFVPEDKVIPLRLSIEDALKLVVSGGVVASPLQAEKPSTA